MGFRGNYALGSNFGLTGWGLVGAGAADLDWDVGAGIDYHFNKRLSATIGYRAIGVNCRNDGFLFDVIERGPMVGMTFRF